jgi:hypothetical protein
VRETGRRLSYRMGRRSTQELLHRIRSDSSDIVGVFVSAGDAENPLANQVDHSVANLAGLSPVLQAGGQTASQTQPLIDGLQQQSTAIAGRVGRIEGHVNGLGNEGWKKNSLSAILWHSKAFLVALVACGKTTLADGRAFVFIIHEFSGLGP